MSNDFAAEADGGRGDGYRLPTTDSNLPVPADTLRPVGDGDTPAWLAELNDLAEQRDATQRQAIIDRVAQLFAADETFDPSCVTIGAVESTLLERYSVPTIDKEGSEAASARPCVETIRTVEFGHFTVVAHYADRGITLKRDADEPGNKTWCWMTDPRTGLTIESPSMLVGLQLDRLHATLDEATATGTEVPTLPEFPEVPDAASLSDVECQAIRTIARPYFSDLLGTSVRIVPLSVLSRNVFGFDLSVALGPTSESLVTPELARHRSQLSNLIVSVRPELDPLYWLKRDNKLWPGDQRNSVEELIGLIVERYTV